MRATLASLIDDFRARGVEHAVVEHKGVRSYRTTYGTLAELAGRFAAEFRSRGVSPGERVVLWGANSASWMAAFFGCVLCGVVATPLDSASDPEFVRRVVNETTPKLLVGDAALLERLGRVDEPTLPLDQMDSLLPMQADYAVDASVHSDTPFQIIFTSGTTSEPKGVVHTHRNVLASLTPIEKEIGKYRRYERLVHPLRFLHTLPLSHVFGQMMGLWIPAILGAELHFTDSNDAGSEIRLIRRERISLLITVPRALALWRAHLLQIFPDIRAMLEPASGWPVYKRWWKFRHVHRAFGWKFWALISGGALLPTETERFWSVLGFAVIQGYGMTETAALVTLNHPFHIAPGTLGKPLPGREVRLSERGEVMVRGEMVSPATWSHGALQKREQEWLATGDLAAETDTGELRFLGREGDAIVTASGLNVFPQDMEAALAKQPGVLGVVVVGCDLVGGAEPVTVVRFVGDDAALREAVVAANSQLAPYQQIRRTLLWPEADFPYTSTGKLLRRKVREWACAALKDQVPDSGNSGDPILALLAEATGESFAGEINDQQRLSEDLHLDSLGRVQLGALLEQRFGLAVDENLLAGLHTLGELRVLVQRTPVQAGREQSSDRGPGPVGEPLPAVSQNPRQVSGEASGAPSRREYRYSYPRWPWLWPVRALRTVFIELVARPLIGFFLAPKVKLAERVPEGPLLVIANHVTALDAALVIYALPRNIRNGIAIAMAGEMLMDFRQGRGQRSRILDLLVPFAYWLITALFNVFPLPRLRGFRESFEHAGAAMDRGYSVLVFPEGTRSGSGELLPFRQGIGLLASQIHAQVVPVALVGLHDVAAGQVRWFRPRRVEVRIGRAISVPSGLTAGEITDRLETAVRGLLS